MKTDLENDLKDLFTEMVADEPPLGAPVEARSTARGSTWTFNVHSALRGALARGFATAGLAGAVAVGAVVAPRIIDAPPTDRPGSLIQPGAAPSERPQPPSSGTLATAPDRTPDTTTSARPGSSEPGQTTTEPQGDPTKPNPAAGVAATAYPSPDAAPPPEPRSTQPPTQPPTQQHDCTPKGNGSIATSVACDAATEAVLRFAHGRVAQKDAETWLTSHAKSRYDRNESGLRLYAPSTERPYASYFVTERASEDDGSVRFTVEINQGYIGKSGDRIRTEHVYVAAATNWRGQPTPNTMAVVNANLVAGPTEP